MLFTARSMVQEPLGFSPSELVFAHTVCGPLKLLQEKQLGGNQPRNLKSEKSKENEGVV